MQPNSSEQIEVKTQNGWIFKIRGQANVRDQSRLNIEMADATTFEDGKIIRVNILKAFPWMFRQFVVGWDQGDQTSGESILNVIYAKPADPTEDVVMVVGAYIYNHVKGLKVTEEDAQKKKA